MYTIEAQPNTLAVIGVDESTPAVFVLPVIGWWNSSSSTPIPARFSPVVLVNVELENAVKNENIIAGAAFVLPSHLTLGNRTMHLLDVVIDKIVNAENYRDRIKLVLARSKKVK